MKKIFYTVDKLSDIAVNNLKDNIDQIDIIAPQCFDVQENGEIAGSIDPVILSMRDQHGKAVMPLFFNTGFNQEKFHAFLSNPAAQQRALASMLEICQQQRCYGLQFDFENIHVKDREQYMNFYQRAAEMLHQHHFAISIAVVPRVNEESDDSPYGKWLFENWSGVFDYKILADCSDFVSLMTYDQHTPRTPPGPVAGIEWVKECLTYALRFLKPDQISLGIPTYSRRWAPGVDQERATGKIVTTSLSYRQVDELIKNLQLSVHWDPQEKVHFSVFRKGGFFEYLYIEDATSLQAKLELASGFGVHSISAWRIGLEDKRIWQILKQVEQATVKSHDGAVVHPQQPAILVQFPSHRSATSISVTAIEEEAKSTGLKLGGK